jgi:hypothetical protein
MGQDGFDLVAIDAEEIDAAGRLRPHVRPELTFELVVSRMGIVDVHEVRRDTNGLESPAGRTNVLAPTDRREGVSDD